MIQNYCCEHTKDQLKTVMNREDKTDIYVLVLNEICKKQEASKNNFVNFINNQDKDNQSFVKAI